MKMKAIVKTRPEPGAEYTEFAVPKVGPGEVLVKVKVCAICGTDIHIYDWNEWAAKTVVKAYGELPRILGHEFCGEVVEVGPNVTKVKVGDRIAAETHIPCGTCFLCRTGDMYNCQDVRRFKTGVFAEYALIPEFSAELVPEGIPDHIAAVFEPFGVAVHGASHVRMVGDTVAIVGTGPIGLFCVTLARAMGASRIIAIDVSDYRLSLAKKVGADYALNTTNVDVVTQVKDLTSGLGVGVVFETSGNVHAVKQSFEMLRKCGSHVMIGLPSAPISLDAGPDIVWKGAKIYGVHGRDTFTTWEIAKNLLCQEIVDLEPLLTHRFAYPDFVKAFELCKAGEAGKVLLYPEKTS